MTEPARVTPSPRLRELLTRLSDAPRRRARTVADFWADVAGRTPLIEDEATGHPGHRRVTFVHRADHGTDSVWLRASCTWFDAEAGAMRRIPDTDIWHTSWVVPEDLRTTYGFVTRTAGGSVDVELAWPEPDRLARLRQVADWGPNGHRMASVLELPNAAPLPWLTSGDTAGGTLTEYEFHSTILDNARTVWMHLPTGEHADLPLLVVFDGVPWHSAPAVVRALSEAGRIPPMAVLLISQTTDRGMQRTTELPCNDDFAAMVATELLPWARREFPITTDRCATVLTGQSFGGLAALWTALRHPAVAGNVIAQSPSCWYHPREQNRIGHPAGSPDGPDPAGVQLPAMLSPGRHTPIVIDGFRSNEPVPVRIWQSVGRHEDGEHRPGVGQLLGNRWLHDVLVGKGYRTYCHEFVGGHDDAWWRGLLGDGLLWVLQRA